VSLLSWVLIGVAVFVVLGAIAALKFGDALDRWQRRKAREAERRRESENDVW